MSAIAGGVGIGAGVGVSSVALAPFNAANTFMGSAFFGYGMILGERYMYQSDWPKIQARLENGEKIENIIQEYTGTFTAVVMKEAKIIFDTVTREFIAIMQQALRDSFPEVTGGGALTPEEERRRSRGGGATQQPAPAPAPVKIPTVGGGFIPPTIGAIQPGPTTPNAPTGLSLSQIKTEYLKQFENLRALVNLLNSAKASRPSVNPMDNSQFLQHWNNYVTALHRYTKFVNKNALQIKAGRYLKVTPYTANFF